MDSMSSIQNIAASLQEIAKRRAGEGERANSGLRIVVVMDIEGTTTALPFVTKILFPYAEANLDSFVANEFRVLESALAEDGVDESPFRAILISAEKETGRSLSCESFCAYIREKMALNSKATHLKLLQGMMWKSGYDNGTIKGHVFRDVPHFLRYFTTKPLQGSIGGTPLTIFGSAEIYSSGSIPAQKMLFGNSTEGNLCTHITGYHDPSSVGPKTEAASYKKIREVIDARRSLDGSSEGESEPNLPAVLVFFTDSVAEISACVASEAFDMCVYVNRPLNNTVSDEDQQKLLKHRINSIVSLHQFEAALGTAFEMPPQKEAEGLDEQKLLSGLEAEVQPFNHSGDLKIFQ